jgi:hypothetical protein
MSIKNGDMPAMPMFSSEAKPCQVRDSSTQSTIDVSGLTKREQFCLIMGVADTGDNELDAIITKGNKQKLAVVAMQGLLSNSVMGDSDLHNNASDWKKDIVESATEFADALLAQPEEKGDVE